MRRTIHWIAMLLALVMSAALPAAAEGTAVTVNGVAVPADNYTYYVSQYTQHYADMGVDTTDPASLGLICDMAMTACIQDELIRQDMQALGCMTFDQATEDWLVQLAEESYQQALLTVQQDIRTANGLPEDADTAQEAAAFAESQGVTREVYLEMLRQEYARQMYYNRLLSDAPITDEEIRTAYDRRVAASRELYEGNAAAFEKALASGKEVWYRPEGYRSILQILIPASGDSSEAVLASVQDAVDEIYARLEQGEDFTVLVREFGQDPNLVGEEALASGYSVHPDSVIWNEEFVAAALALQQPGDWSPAPVVSGNAVRILCYLRDIPGGPLELTDSVREALAYTLYQERAEQLLAERVDALSREAEVVFPD